jgi:Xaa-Pro aminopeptidase
MNKQRQFPRTLLICALILLSLQAVPAQRRVADAPPMPKLLSLREQTAVREGWLRTRLDTMLLPMMRRHKAGMWIVVNEEFHQDPLMHHIAPPLPYVGRRDFFIFTDQGGDKPECLAVVRYPEERLKNFFEVINPPGRETAATLQRLARERNPQSIALNMGGGRGATGGLTHDAYKFLAETLGPEFSSRFVSAAPLITEYLDTRLPAELEHYRAAVLVTDILTRRALSNEVITPGKTTAGDVRWWMLQQVNNLGLTVWFQPDLRIQRQNAANSKTQQFLSVADEAMVIQRGDVVHVDFGLDYLGLSTDWQKMAYVLRPGERDVPAGLKKAMLNTNRLQDLMFGIARPGMTGAEVFDRTMAECQRQGIEAMIYSHSVGAQGHALGAAIDFRRLSGGEAEYLREGAYTSIELNTSTPVAEWGGQKVTVMAEDDAYLTNTGWQWFRPRQTAFYLIR